MTTKYNIFGKNDRCRSTPALERFKRVTFRLKCNVMCELVERHESGSCKLSLQMNDMASRKRGLLNQSTKVILYQSLF